MKSFENQTETSPIPTQTQTAVAVQTQTTASAQTQIQTEEDRSQASEMVTDRTNVKSKEQANELLFLTPIFHEKIWGGRRLETDFGYTVPDGPVGECWAISAHPNGDCNIANGPYKGMRLSELWKNAFQLFVNPQGAESVSTEELALQHQKEPFPLLVKIIDAHEKLSIQVHPDDAYAAKHENGSLGKRECWYILAVEPGATIIVGQKTHSKEEFQHLMEVGAWHEVLNEIPLAAGDFFQIDPGTVHAIKGGTMVLETQQSSDVTYRLYDYDRVDAEGNKRPLHIQKSLDTIDFAAPLPSTAHPDLSEPGLHLLEKNDTYTVFHLSLVEPYSEKNEFVLHNEHPFLCLSVIEGKGTVTAKEETVAIKKGDHFICPGLVEELSFSGAMQLIVSHP